MVEEKEFTPKSLTENWVQLLNYGGCSPQNQTFTKKIINSVYVLCCSSVVFLSVLESILFEYKSLTEFTKMVIIIVGYIQVTIKFITCRIKSKILLEMLDIMWNKFWYLDSVTPKTKATIMQTYKHINIVTKIYLIVILGSIFSVIIQAVLTNQRILPLDIWLPYKDKLKQSPYFEICYIIQVVFMFSHDIFVVVPFDALFASMIGLVYCQFNIIKEKLLEIGNNNNNEKNFDIIKKCVEHHNLLLRFLKMLESVFSNAILPIIGSGLCLATLNLYAIVMEDDNSLKALFVVLYICIFLQLYFYCQAGQIIQDEAESIGEAAYDCNWTNISNKNVVDGLKLIILRSQRKFNITAGGFMILNLENFGSVVQTSFTFLTFLENVKS